MPASNQDISNRGDISNMSRTPVLSIKIPSSKVPNRIDSPSSKVSDSHSSNIPNNHSNREYREKCQSSAVRSHTVDLNGNRTHFLNLATGTCPKEMINILGFEVKALIDTGSQVSVINHISYDQIAQSCQVHQAPQFFKMTAVNGTNIGYIRTSIN